MPVAAGRRLVAAPSVAPSRYGLFSAADMPAPDGDSHWLAGVDFEADTCAEALATTDGCPATGGVGDTPTKSPSVTGIADMGAEPFTVYAQIKCGPVGMVRDLAEFELRTTNALTRGEGRAVERVFWTGVAPGVSSIRPHLAANAAAFTSSPSGAVVTQVQTAATVVTTGAVDVVEAIGKLEGALALCYGGEGIIHVPAEAVAHLAAWNLIVRDGDRLRTWYGNRVAVYASNDKEGPTGAVASAGQAWFYATGAILIRRTPIFGNSRIRQSVDRSENLLFYAAERTYVVEMDMCCHLAAQVSLGGIVTGTQSTAT